MAELGKVLLTKVTNLTYPGPRRGCGRSFRRSQDTMTWVFDLRDGPNHVNLSTQIVHISDRGLVAIPN